MLKRILHKLLGYKVVLIFPRGPVKAERFVTRNWLSEDGTVRALWLGKQVILNRDKTVSGFPKEWHVTWELL